MHDIPSSFLVDNAPDEPPFAVDGIEVENGTPDDLQSWQASERFRMMLENISDLVAEVDEQGRYTYLSPNHREISGYAPEELLGRNAMDFIHPDDMEGFVSVLQGLQRGEHDVRLELRCLRADGQWSWLEGVARAYALADGQQRVVCVSRDITERKRLEQERALLISLSETINSQLDLHAVARALSHELRPLLPFDLFFISQLDGDGLRIVASELPLAAERDFKLEFNRQSNPLLWKQLIDDQEAFLCNDFDSDRHIAEKLSDKPRENNLHTRSYINTPLVVDGQTVGLLHFDSIAVNAFNQDHVRLTVSIAQHISGAVRQMQWLQAARVAEQQARSAEGRFRELVQQIEAIVWEADAQNQEFTFVSSQAENWLGCPSQSWLGPFSGTFLQYVHEDDREKLLLDCLEATALGTDHTLEFRLVARDGRVLWVRDLVSVESRDGVPVRLYGIMFDITERKRQEQEQNLLLRLMKTINAQRDLQSLVRELRRHLQPLIPCDVLFISRVRSEYLKTEAVDPPQHHKRDWSIKIGDHSAAFDDPRMWDAIERREPYASNHFSQFNPSNNSHCLAAETNAFINVPLIVNDQLLGLLHIDSVTPNVYTSEHFRLAQLVGEEVAIAMQQALLIEQANRSEAEVRESNAILQATQEAAADGMFLVDELGAVVSCNRRFGELWQIEPEIVDELCEKQQLLLHIVSMMKEPDEFLEKITYLVDFPDASTRDEISLNDGRTFERFSSPAIAPDGRVYGRVWSFSDLTERKQFEHRLTHQAFHDPLTGLPNRALFTESLTRALARAQRSLQTIAVLFLDLDRFKVVNDSLGHETGDQLLIEASRRLKACLRPGDLAARFGGDEFTVLLENVENLQDATRVAERISESLGASFDLNGHDVGATASVGIVLSRGMDRGDDLLRDADVAMYRAKNKGRARYEVFDSEMSAQAFERLKIEIDLRQALKRNQLRLHYQPLIDLNSGRIIGAEALVRWQHPERGLIFPAEFIELAEECGMIFPLGNWVLRDACAQAKAWTRKYFNDSTPFSMSVNLSVKQFGQMGLVDEIESALRDSGLPAAQLNLEITESVMMHSGGASHEMLQALRTLGVQLALDDFGTGFSSLSYLKEFPLDSLKVDRSFISRTAANPQDRAIVQAVHDLAKALGMKVIGEGIETGEQLAQLRALGCDVGQGYFFSKPVPADEFARLLETLPQW